MKTNFIIENEEQYNKAVKVLKYLWLDRTSIKSHEQKEILMNLIEEYESKEKKSRFKN